MDFEFDPGMTFTFSPQYNKPVYIVANMVEEGKFEPYQAFTMLSKAWNAVEAIVNNPFTSYSQDPPDWKYFVEVDDYLTVHIPYNSKDYRGPVVLEMVAED